MSLCTVRALADSMQKGYCWDKGLVRKQGINHLVEAVSFVVLPHPRRKRSPRAG